MVKPKLTSGGESEAAGIKKQRIEDLGEVVKRSYISNGVLVNYNVKRPAAPGVKQGVEDGDAIRNGDAVRKALDAVEVGSGEQARLGFIARNHEVRFTRKAFEQVEFLRRISEQGMLSGSVREIPAYFIGKKAEEGGKEFYLVSRVEVPPFNFRGDSTVPKPRLYEVELKPGEIFLGTFHTHPAGFEVPSAQDLDPNGILRSAYFWVKGQTDGLYMNGKPESEKDFDQWHFNIIAPKGDKWRVYEMDPGSYELLSDKYPVREVGFAPIEEMRELECTPRDLK